MSEIESKLRENRKELSENSIKTYTSILNNLYKKIYGDEKINLKKFNNVNFISQYLPKNINVRKTYYSALYVLTNIEEYKIKMLDDINEYNEEIEKQEKTETQKNNWIETETINNKIDELFPQFITNINLISKTENKNKLYQQIQDFIILCLTTGKFIQPRRLKDYTEFKIKQIDKNKDNYLEGTNFYFNTYKGSDKKGLQKIKIPIKLKNILVKWININPTNYLLFDKNFNKLSSVKLNQRLNKIFNGKISVNALRHTYLTDKHQKTIIDLDNLKKDLNLMGSSILQAKTYIKK
jgi:hypothetical protein